jgi:tRNA U34 5-carboxymethylaminomethyl modifying enzyme MnmG/GidA
MGAIQTKQTRFIDNTLHLVLEPDCLVGMTVYGEGFSTVIDIHYMTVEDKKELARLLLEDIESA